MNVWIGTYFAVGPDAGRTTIGDAWLTARRAMMVKSDVNCMLMVCWLS